MLGEISIPYPSWYILLCFLLGAAYAVFLYWRDHKFGEQKPWLPYLLSFLRGTAVTGLAWLLLAPLLKTITQDVKRPIVVVAQDASASMQADSAQVKAQLSRLGSTLSDRYDIVPINFGDNVKEGLSDSTTYQSTDISEALRYVQDNFADQNLGAVVLATDGIYNEGRDPRYVSKAAMPVYTIAYGDTTKRRDISIKNVYSNRIAYLGDQFVVQIDVQAFNASGSNSRLTVNKVQDGKLQRLREQPLRIAGNEYFETVSLTLDADQTGVVHYRVAVAPITDEVNTTNNYKDFYVEVLDSRQRILLLANAPHPDIAALKTILSNKKNYEVTVAYPDDIPDDLRRYNLAILHNLPSASHRVLAELSQLAKARVPQLFILGSQSAVRAFNEAQDVVTVSGGNNIDEVQAVLRPAFSGYILDQPILNRLSNYPPLVAPFGEYKAVGPTEVVFNQRIKTVDTDYPLLAFAEQSGLKTGVLAGEGIWRWRLFNYMKDKNYAVVDEFVSKAIQYLVVKDDRRKFRAGVSKRIYKETESVLIEAQLFNDSYEQVNEPDAFVKIVAQDGKVYDYTMSKTNRYYTLDAGLFEPGSYRFTVSTSYSGKTLTQEGRFSVRAVQLESYDLTARHDVLDQLATSSGAAMYYPDQVNELATYLTKTNQLKPVLYDTIETQSVLNFKWIFFVLLLLLVIEWFCRRYFGYY